jgi:hypothetical protein
MSKKTLRQSLVGSALCLALGCGDKRRAPEPPPAPPPPVAAEPAPEPVAAEDPQCGHAGQPDCPLQAWMDAQLNTAMSDGNFAGGKDGRELQLLDVGDFVITGWADDALKAVRILSIERV